MPEAAPTAGVAALASGRAAPASPGASSATRLSCSTRPTGKPPTTSSAPAAGYPAPAPTNTIASATAESLAIGRSVRRDATILVSLATEELARDTLDHGLEFVDLGEHRLRNLARAERVFQLAGPGLPDDVDPPTWLDVVPGNLPLQVTSFVGREDAVVEIAGAVRTGPLVTITGTGGVGKTRLALQIVGRMLDDYRDGGGSASSAWRTRKPRPSR